jgi:hypothetical protein
MTTGGRVRQSPSWRRALLHDAGALALAGDEVGGTAGPPARRGGDRTTSLCRGGEASIQRRALLRDTGALARARDTVGGTAGPPARRGGDRTTLLHHGGEASRATVVPVSIQCRALLHDAGALALAGDKVGGTVGPPDRRGGNRTTLLRRGGEALQATVVHTPIQCGFNVARLRVSLGHCSARTEAGGATGTPGSLWWLQAVAITTVGGRAHQSPSWRHASARCRCLGLHSRLPHSWWPPSSSWRGVVCRCGTPSPLWWVVVCRPMSRRVGIMRSCATPGVCLAFIIIAACGGVPLVWWLVAHVRPCDVAA